MTLANKIPTSTQVDYSYSPPAPASGTSPEELYLFTENYVPIIHPHRKNINELELSYGKVNIILDSYTDIFSDFDPRPFSTRSLSDDFLEECRKRVLGAHKHKLLDDETELGMLIPHDVRHPKTETEILDRLHKFFKQGYQRRKRQYKKSCAVSLGMVIFGALVLGASFILSWYEQSADCTVEPGLWQMILNLVLVLLDPAGWFLSWEGLSRLVFYKPGYEKKQFYRNMAKLTFVFVPYEFSGPGGPLAGGGGGGSGGGPGGGAAPTTPPATKPQAPAPTPANATAGVAPSSPSATSIGPLTTPPALP